MNYSHRRRDCAHPFLSPVVSCKQLWRHWHTELGSAQANINQWGGVSAAPTEFTALWNPEPSQGFLEELDMETLQEGGWGCRNPRWACIHTCLVCDSGWSCNHVPFFQKPKYTHQKQWCVCVWDSEHWRPSGPDSPSPLHLDNWTGIRLEMYFSPVSLGFLYKI